MFKLSRQGRSPSRTLSRFGEKGMNRSVSAPFTSVKYNKVQVNYWNTEKGKEGRKGHAEIGDMGELITGEKPFSNTETLIGFGTSIGLFNEETKEFLLIKDDYKENEGFSIEVAGDYAFVANNEDDLSRLSRRITLVPKAVLGMNVIHFNGEEEELDFVPGQIINGPDWFGTIATVQYNSDEVGVLKVNVEGGMPGIDDEFTQVGGPTASVTQINPFEVGEKIIGEDASAIILEKNGNEYVLGDIRGEFTLERVDGDKDGIGDITETLNWKVTENVAPASRSVVLREKHLILVGLKSEPWTCQFSPQDDGSNPAFNQWNEGSTLSDSFKQPYKSAGNARSVEVLNSSPISFVIFGERGFNAFSIGQIDTGGILSRITPAINFDSSSGAADASFTTTAGIYTAVNKKGIYRMTSVGYRNIFNSSDRSEVTNLLGDDFFKDVDFSNTDMVEYHKNNSVLITCAKSSARNNIVIVLDRANRSIYYFDGMFIQRFFKSNEELYATSSIDGRIFKMFVGSKDGDNEINYRLVQEVPTGSPTSRKDTSHLHVQGQLKTNSEVKFTFNAIDEKGAKAYSTKCLAWSTDALREVPKGYALSKPIGEHISAEYINAPKGYRMRIPNFVHLEVEVTSNSPHILEWFTLDYREKGKVRNR